MHVSFCGINSKPTYSSRNSTPPHPAIFLLVKLSALIPLQYSCHFYFELMHRTTTSHYTSISFLSTDQGQNAKQDNA